MAPVAYVLLICFVTYCSLPVFFIVTQCLVLTLKKSVVNKIIVVFIRLQE